MAVFTLRQYFNAADSTGAAPEPPGLISRAQAFAAPILLNARTRYFSVTPDAAMLLNVSASAPDAAVAGDYTVAAGESRGASVNPSSTTNVAVYVNTAAG